MQDAWRAFTWRSRRKRARSEAWALQRRGNCSPEVDFELNFGNEIFDQRIEKLRLNAGC
jgi:hypothetical protein